MSLHSEKVVLVWVKALPHSHFLSFFCIFLTLSWHYLFHCTHFCHIHCQPRCKMVITSNKHEGKPTLPYFNLSLCHVFVKGRSMHILDIPLACCLTHPCTLLSITLSHFFSSISPEAESNRAQQTGWSEQNCDWQSPADSLWNSLKPCECMWMFVCFCVRICMYTSAGTCTAF